MKASELPKLLALAADEIIVAIFLVVILPALGIDVPLSAVAAVIGVLLLKDFLIVPFVVRGGLVKRPETGPESLIGHEALVVEDLSPEGVVKVRGEFWRAECLNGTARRGERVKVVDVRGTKVLVERRG
ncbi:MAG: NfeD family protein [Thermococcus sp.]|nr:NfeD family protein [Thermococcus sp.]